MLDEQKKKQLNILVNIAKVDEDFPEEEKEVIARISKKYGADDQELADLLNTPQSHNTLAPMSGEEKMNFMMDCMLVVLADQVVTNSERAFASQMAYTLGFKEDVIPFLIENKDTSREEMCELMLDYMVQN